MSKARELLRKPFGSALLGGAVVALAGWLAIAAGWIEADAGTTTRILAPSATPAVDGAADPGPTTTINRIYERDGKGVAFVEAERAGAQSQFGFGGPPGGGTATGSGFVIDEAGHVLTNSHVVAGASEILVTLGDSDTAYPAEVVGTDPATDLALLRADAPEGQLHPLPLGNSARVEVGDPVVAIGNPFGLDRTVTSGIVSALQRQIEAPNGFAISNVIQTDAPINPGNSGGPLIDSAGDVIGVTSQIETAGGGGNVGIGFAVPINTAREVVAQLLDSGRVEHAFLGLRGATIEPQLADAVNLPVEQGVLVQEVTDGGPSDEAGIRGGDASVTLDGAGLRLGGDIITALDGRRVSSMEDVVDIVNAADPGDRLEVTLLRGDERRTATVTLGDRPR
jgi:S1-C subfamily serine protease